MVGARAGGQNGGMETFVLILDLIGTFAFALSGATLGVRRRLDIFGVLVLSFAAALAGGMTRDVLIGATPVVAISDWRYPATTLVAGVVTHRQRPATAAGVTFVNLEDETGLINVVVSKGCWVRHRRIVQSGPALLVRGRLECAEGVTNVVAETIEPLPLAAGIPSRDFR